MTKFVSLALAALMICFLSSTAFAAESSGALPEPQFLVLAREAYDEAVPYKTENFVRAEAAQADEIKKLLASFRADSLTQVLVNDAHAPMGTRIPLSKADVATVLKALQAMEFTAYSPTEYETAISNPMAGGGVAVYLQQGSLRCEISNFAFSTVRIGADDTPYMLKCADPNGALNDFISAILGLYDGTTNAVCSLVPEQQLIKTFSSVPAQFAKQQDLNLYRQWVAAVDARKITKIQYQPFAYEGAARKLKPNQLDFLLRALHATNELAVFSEPQNPATGGGDCVYLEYGGKPVLLQWDNFWLIVQLPDWHKPLIFDMRGVSTWWYEAKNDLGLDSVPTFKNQPVSAVYALNTTGGLTAKLPAFTEDMLTALEEYQRNSDTTTKSSGYGFLIYTQAGKEYVYLMDGAPADLLKTCKDGLAANPNAMQWFTHMTPSKLLSARFTPYDGAPEERALPDVTITDPTRLGAVSDFLKTQLRPIGACTATKGEVNPASGGAVGQISLRFVLEFQTGGRYVCHGSFLVFSSKNATFSIYSSDVDTTMSYPVSADSFLKLVSLAKKGFVS